MTVRPICPRRRFDDTGGVRDREGTSPAVDVRGLHVRFGEVEAVTGVDLRAYAGEATALLGRNGAGKSTTMRVLAGVVPPTEGSVLVGGLDVARDPVAVKRQVGENGKRDFPLAPRRGRA